MGDISFSCGPATIPITIAAGLSVKFGHFFKIDGGNLITLTGVVANRIFNVQAGGALTLTNLILSDGSAFSTSYFQNDGGALLNTGGTLVLNQITVRNSSANEGGGAIENMSGTLSVSDSLLASNSAGRGGAIDSAGTLLISHTLVTSNTISGSNGGGLWTSGSALVANSAFVNNRAFIGPLFDPLAGRGGAIYNLGTLSVTNSTLDYNFANQGGGGLWNDMGATTMLSVEVSVNTVTPSCNIFGTCSGPGTGGGIGNGGGSVTLDLSRLEGNQVFTGTGGAIYNTGSLSLLNLSRLYGNAALNGGGGIFSTNRLTISESFITANEIGCFPCIPVPGSGGGLYLSGTSFITLCLISNNRATLDGGAIYNAGTLTVTLTDFDGNSAPGNGGAIENLGTATLTDSDFENHQTAERGGALSNNQGTLSVLNGHITSNSAHFGGGVTNSGALTVTGTLLDRNSAGAGGGLLSSGSLFMTGTTVSNNQAQNNGGAADGGGLWLTGTARIFNSTISGNAADNGGGLYNGHSAFFDSVTINANTAITDGGGIYNAGGWNALYVTLSGNSAGLIGGALYNQVLASAYAQVALFAGNSAVFAGGVYNDNILTLGQTAFVGNSAFRGAGIANANGSLTLYNSTLGRNVAAGNAGGIDQRDRASLVNVTLSNNSALLGGALWLSGPTLLTNTIIAYSASGGNCSGALTSSIYSISSDNTCNLAGTVKGLNPNNLDPLLTALGDYGGDPVLHLPVHLPKLGSPAIDGVVGNLNLGYDQRGFPRPQGAGYDIGAVERQPSDVDTIPKLWLPLVER